MAPILGNDGTLSVGGVVLGQVESWEISRHPTVCDLSTDPLACAILRCWARQPWAEVHRCALIDRMIELGHEDRWKWAEPMVKAHVPWVVLAMKFFPRRCARYRLQIWKLRLQDAFGRFE